MAIAFPPVPLPGDRVTGPFGEVYEFDQEKWTLVVGGGGGGAAPGGASVHIGTSPPAVAAQGDLWWDNTPNAGRLYVRDGGWIGVSAPGGGAGGTPVTLGTFPPANPQQGALWWRTDIASLFVYDGAAWIVAVNNGSAGGPFVPEAPDDGQGYMRYGLTREWGVAISAGYQETPHPQGWTRFGGMLLQFGLVVTGATGTAIGFNPPFGGKPIITFGTEGTAAEFVTCQSLTATGAYVQGWSGPGVLVSTTANWIAYGLAVP